MVVGKKKKCSIKETVLGSSCYLGEYESNNKDDSTVKEWEGRIGDRANCVCAVSVVGRMARLQSGSTNCIDGAQPPVDALLKSTISRCSTRAHVSPDAPPRAPMYSQGPVFSTFLFYFSLVSFSTSWGLFSNDPSGLVLRWYREFDLSGLISFVSFSWLLLVLLLLAR